jgi:FkbM family methyltransferase
VALARLDISIRNAVRGPGADAEALERLEQDAGPLPGADSPQRDGAPRPVPPRPRWRRAFGWLRPIAGFGRGYLQAPVASRLDMLIGRIDMMQAQLAAIMRTQTDQTARLERLETASRSTGANVEAVAANVEAIAVNVDTILGLIGPRFDELEVKIRPLIAYDADSYAVRVIDGYVMIPRDEPVFTVMMANATSGGLEPGVRRVITALLEPGMIAADVGANVGLLTLACARAVGPEGRVYAFEPEAGPRKQLEKTLYLNGLRWVELSATALGARPGRRTLHVSSILGHSSLYALPDETTTACEVEVARLDDAIPAGLTVDLVKIDVEGAELDVLEGMGRILAQNTDIAIIAEYGPSHLLRVGIGPADWFAAFKRHGLRPFAIQEPGGACRAIEPGDVAKVDSVNLVFVRPGGRAELRLFS